MVHVGPANTNSLNTQTWQVARQVNADVTTSKDRPARMTNMDMRTREKGCELPGEQNKQEGCAPNLQLASQRLDVWFIFRNASVLR